MEAVDGQLSLRPTPRTGWSGKATERGDGLCSAGAKISSQVQWESKAPRKAGTLINPCFPQGQVSPSSFALGWGKPRMNLPEAPSSASSPPRWGWREFFRHMGLEKGVEDQSLWKKALQLGPPLWGDPRQAIYFPSTGLACRLGKMGQ